MLRFELMIERGLSRQPQASGREAQHGLLRNFGFKVGIVGTVKFEERIHELVDGMLDLEEIMEPPLAARRELRAEFAHLHKKVQALAKKDAICIRLMTSLL